NLLTNLLRLAGTARNKVLLIGTTIPRLGKELQKRTEIARVGGLEQRSSQDMFAFWFRFERKDLSGHIVTAPERVMAVLAGHPLGIKIAAKLCAERPVEAVASDLALFKHLRETVVAYILERVSLSNDERKFLCFSSVFRLPVRRDVFFKWGSGQATLLLDSLLGRSLLESDTDKYQLHPIVQD